MKYFIVSGERSGDLHASNLLKAIKKNDPQTEVMAWGGEYLENEGANIVMHYKNLAFMGFWEVIKNLPKIIGFLATAKKQMSSFQPDAIILVDYAGMNMKIAKWAKSKDFKVFYYISPKVWAWNQSRAYQLKKNIDRLFVIFPFEVDFFKKFDYEVEFVGNPLFDAIGNFKPNGNFLQKNNLTSSKLVALLPGSRKQEVEKILEMMVLLKKSFPEYHFVIAGVSNLPVSMYKSYLSNDISLVIDQTYDLLMHSEAAIVTSGTATLETALLKVPQVVVYKTSALSYFLGKYLIKVPFISLVNLIAQKLVVPELIQENFNINRLQIELKQLLEHEEIRQKQLAEYEIIRNILGVSGASEKVGSRIVEILKSNHSLT